MGTVKTNVFRRTETPISEAEERARALQQVLAQIGEAVIVKDMNAVVTYWNREAMSLYGFSPEEAVGQPLRKLHAASLSEADYEKILQRIPAREPTSSTTRPSHTRGENRPV